MAALTESAVTADRHSAACCVLHGCAFNSLACPVMTGEEMQNSLCPRCPQDEEDAAYTLTAKELRALLALNSRAGGYRSAV